jgi:site-specific DNA recombinase
VRWVFAQRLAGHSTARIARALNEAGIPCPSASDPKRNPHRPGTGWTLGTVTTILGNPTDASLGHKDVQRWNLPDGCVISSRPAHETLVSEEEFVAAQGVSVARGPTPRADPAGPQRRRYLLSGMLACGVCGRRMESAWSNDKLPTASRNPIRAGRRRRTYARTGSLHTCPPCTCS